jgi:D-3-phosphoglycerate dehydrogenase
MGRRDMSAAATTVLITETDDHARAAAAHLGERFAVRFADLATRSDLLAAVGDADVVWVRLRHRIDREVIDAAPRLRCVASATTGHTHLDEAALAARGIAILSLRGQTEFLRTIRATAEFTIALTLNALRQLKPATRAAEAGDWDRRRFIGGELNGRTIGIIGFGRLGRMVADLFAAFGATVLATDPTPPAPADIPSHVTLVSLKTLLARADVVSLHANVTDHNARFVNADTFALMRRGAVFVNTARGELVDETALLAALASGQLAAAACDVVSNEQPALSAHPLVRAAATMPNLIVTPHIGGATHESLARAEAFIAGRIMRELA